MTHVQVFCDSASESVKEDEDNARRLPVTICSKKPTVKICERFLQVLFLKDKNEHVVRYFPSERRKHWQCVPGIKNSRTNNKSFDF